jgi:glycosyltransferase involved in cell wall biosynthesis
MIKTRWVFRLQKIYTKKVIATAWITAELLNKLNINNVFDMYYLIQGDESKFDEVIKYNWQNRVYATWQYNWKCITITDFLFEMIKQHNQNIIKIVNGVDCDKYKIITPIEYRDKFAICMLGHIFEWKGTRIGIAALEILKNKYPDLQVTIFSVYPKMRYIPDWITYEYMASQARIVDIYNQATIFISCSYTEGFGLPFVEAMACGCATVVSDIPAYRDIANDSMTLYFDAGNINALVSNIELLLNNDMKRIEYMKNGNQYVKSTFSFDKSADLFEKFIL